MMSSNEYRTGGTAPRITVVTACLNMQSFLEATLEATLANLMPGDEYFVIDGGSSDGSQDIIRRYEDRLTGWISEPDSGYADALAKGFDRATGEVLCWINAGDLLLDGALDRVRRSFTDSIDLLYGDDFYIDEGDRVISFSRGWIGNLSAAMLYGGWTPLQDACFWRRSLYEQVGGINRSMKYAADYDLFLRMSGRGRCDYLPVAFSAFRQHVGQKSIAGAGRYREERRAARLRELSALGIGGLRGRLLDLRHSLAVRWRIRVLQRSWRRPDLRGRPVSSLTCGPYWPPGAEGSNT
jgi:glycosyltransferase involved in cell wall biosynthesis